MLTFSALPLAAGCSIQDWPRQRAMEDNIHSVRLAGIVDITTSDKVFPEPRYAGATFMATCRQADLCGIPMGTDKMTCFRTRDLSGLSAYGSLDAV
jgi:hypothetical protein